MNVRPDAAEELLHDDLKRLPQGIFRCGQYKERRLVQSCDSH